MLPVSSASPVIGGARLPAGASLLWAAAARLRCSLLFRRNQGHGRFATGVAVDVIIAVAVNHAAASYHPTLPVTGHSCLPDEHRRADAPRGQAEGIVDGLGTYHDNFCDRLSCG